MPRNDFYEDSDKNADIRQTVNTIIGGIFGGIAGLVLGAVVLPSFGFALLGAVIGVPVGMAIPFIVSGVGAFFSTIFRSKNPTPDTPPNTTFTMSSDEYPGVYYYQNRINHGGIPFFGRDTHGADNNGKSGSNQLDNSANPDNGISPGR